MSGLKRQLSLEQTKSLGLVTKVNKLQTNVTFLNRQIQRCEVSRNQALQDLTICSCANTATSVPSTEHNQQVIISTMQRTIDRLTAEKSELNSKYQLMLTENQKAKQNINKLNEQITTLILGQKPQLESRPTDDGQSSYDWSDLLESTPGKIVVAVGGAFFLLFLVFFTVSICFCVKKRSGSKSARKYDVQMANMAFD